MKTNETSMRLLKRFPMLMLIACAFTLPSMSALAQELNAPPAARELAVERSRACITGDCISGYGELEINTSLGQNIYRGYFLDSKFHGNGKLTEMVTRTNRAYYDGNWENGLRSGRGTYWDGVADLYIGEWKDGKRHGRGSYFFGVKDWTENKYSENYLSDHVANYTGEFMTDFYHGQGTFRWPDGKRYVGGFFAGKKHGKAMFYYETGSARPQMWEYGKFLY